MKILGKFHQKQIQQKDLLSNKLGLIFYDQSHVILKFNEIEINKIAFPLIFLPFLSRTSEIIGKRIFLK